MRFIKSSDSLKHYSVSASELVSEEASLINGIVDGGGIHSRPAFESRVDAPIYADNGMDADETFPVITESSIFYKGRFGRVIINVRNNLIGNLVFEMRLVHPEGDSLDLGRIEFSRSNNGDMGYPQTYTVFSGTPIRGSGVFFICRQTYSGDSPDFYRIMELSSDLESWIMLGSESMYVPTLLANGRGDGYFRAAPYGELLDLPDPIHPQSRNLISSAFDSYFTTDSTSVWFTLPEAGLDNATVECQFTYIGHIYEFTVYPDAEVSEGIDVDGFEVIMMVDREMGEICFKTTEGRDFALPYAGKLNNLWVRAYKTSENDLKRVGSMSGCIGLSSSVSTGESDVTLFYGNQHFPSEMIWNSPLHPMYFPADNHLALGDGGVPIDRITVKDKVIFAFKENRIFLSETGMFEGDDKIISEEGIAKKVSDYKITFKKSLSTPAAPIGSSICVTEDGICFADRKGNIYRLKTSGGHICERLCRVSDMPGEGVFALADKNRYMLFGGKGAFVLEKDKNGKLWFYNWNFAENILGGFSYLGNILLVGLIRNGVEAMLFPILPSAGCEDKKAAVKDGRITTEACPIKLEAELLPVSTPYKKRLYRLFAEGEGELQISFFENDKRLKTERLSLKRGGGAINAGIIARRPKLVLSAEGDFSVRSICIDYRNLKE